MISFGEKGLWVDAADIRAGHVSNTYVEVVFLNGASVNVTREFIEHCAAVFEAVDRREKKKREPRTNAARKGG